MRVIKQDENGESLVEEFSVNNLKSSANFLFMAGWTPGEVFDVLLVEYLEKAYGTKSQKT